MNSQSNPSYLLSLIEGCLNPASVTINQQQLNQYAQTNYETYIQQLLQLIPNIIQNHPVLMMLLATLKAYLVSAYGAKHEVMTEGIVNNKLARNIDVRPLHPTQKTLLLENTFNLYYALQSDAKATQLYEQILYLVISMDYPWVGVGQQLDADLSESAIASITFLKQFSRVYEFLVSPNERKLKQQIISKYLPHLEVLLDRLLMNYGPQQAIHVEKILKIFYQFFHCQVWPNNQNTISYYVFIYSSNSILIYLSSCSPYNTLQYLQIPHYLRQADKIDKWLHFLDAIIRAPLPFNIDNQRIVSRIFVRLCSTYASDSQDQSHCKGWAAQYRARYCPLLLGQLYELVIHFQGDQETISNLIQAFNNIIKNRHLFCIVTQQHCNLVYDYLLPRMVLSQTDLQLASVNPVQFLRRQEDLNCFLLRRSALDLIQNIVTYYEFNGKSQLMRFIEHVAAILTSPDANELYKDVLLKTLIHLKEPVLKNKFLKKNFQQLTLSYFLPILNSSTPFLISTVCLLLAVYVQHVSLCPQTVSCLLTSIYNRLINGSILIRFPAACAFTELLSHRTARQGARPQFQNILTIYISIMQAYDHHKLVSCLQIFVQDYAQQIVNVAPSLMTHLIKSFYNDNAAQDGQNSDDDQQGNVRAIACLSTIGQVLKANLHPDMYLQASVQLIEMFKGVFSQINHCFSEILKLIAILTWKAPNLIDYQLLYVGCRQLLTPHCNCLQLSSLDIETKQYISTADLVDHQHQQNLLAIIKNCIQKMPQDLLYRFPLPNHPQLILCMLQNRRLPGCRDKGIMNPQLLNNSLITVLNQSNVVQSASWSLILQSYAAYIYGYGQLCSIQQIHPVPGVSLQPWIVNSFGIDLLNRYLKRQKDIKDAQCQADDDDLQQQNTMQLLTRFANEPDNDQDDQFVADQEGSSYDNYYQSAMSADNDIKLIKKQWDSIILQTLLNEQQKIMILNALKDTKRTLFESLLTQND